MKSATVAVRVSGVLNDKSDAIALLVPADNRLTLRESCYSNRLRGPETDFRFVPPGKYRLVVFNSKYVRDVSAYAPRVPAFLDRESVEVGASPEHDATATASFIKRRDDRSSNSRSWRSFRSIQESPREITNP
jgi:hypothetical protein